MNSNNANTPVEQLWCSFHDHLLNTFDEFVSSKMVPTNNHGYNLILADKNRSKAKATKLTLCILAKL